MGLFWYFEIPKGACYSSIAKIKESVKMVLLKINVIGKEAFDTN